MLRDRCPVCGLFLCGCPRDLAGAVLPSLESVGGNEMKSKDGIVFIHQLDELVKNTDRMALALERMANCLEARMDGVVNG